MGCVAEISSSQHKGKEVFPDGSSRIFFNLPSSTSSFAVIATIAGTSPY